MEKIPVVIDTDPGIDDFFALMLAASLENLEIKALCSVAGNQDLGKVSENLRRICGLLGLRARVAAGAGKPILGERIAAGHIYGENGLGDVRLPDCPVEFDRLPAWDVLYEEAKKAGAALRLIVIGPLTNAAIALLKYPDLKRRLRDIVLMGGSADFGNVSAFGEFNIVADPEAADIVFQSGVPIRMVGLNATRLSGLREAELQEFSATCGRYSGIVRELLAFLRESGRARGFDEVVLHDALAVAFAAREEVLELKACRVAVETRGGMCRGRTAVETEPWREKASPNALVAFGVDRELYLSMLREMLARWA